MEIVRAGEEGQTISREDIIFLLSTAEEEEKEDLFKTADRVRHSCVGDEVYLRAIVEFSNFCVQDCLYCGLRRGNDRIPRYRMTPSEIVEAAKNAQSLNFATVVLQSGEDPWFTRERMARLIREIKEQTNLVITLSLGERSYQDYQAWKEAGADRFLLKQETSSASLYEKLRPGKRLLERIQCLQWLKDLGYQTGSGNIVGLPGQALEDLAEDILFFREFDFDMVGIGPFIAHPKTPLGGAANGALDLTLKVLAVTRIVTRDTNLPATTAVGTLSPDGRRKALRAGANVVMPDLTPWGYRQYYEIYPGKVRVKEQGHWKGISLPSGRTWGKGPGNRIRSPKGSQL